MWLHYYNVYKFTKRSYTAEYLGMTIDVKLHWKEHERLKNEEPNIKFRKMECLLGETSELSVYNKLLLCKKILIPVWICGIQLCHCATRSNIKMIERFQYKVFWSIVNAPWYFKNAISVEILRWAPFLLRLEDLQGSMKNDYVNMESLKFLGNPKVVLL